ncbi:DUF2264 domain-containing protein [Sphingobium sp. AS12]|uniref:DUF2264 domain-containing protein n=1 Tax=Sphingobium sp. AS12 TaxID=2849495 RepID=UPI001C31A07F|nr:DUF2264 domain-containing protein [Sphingobium sp. AS12]MBV2149751.1 DUF2264 domain-containing protein [Sphingobium sp. AS12]
MISAVIGWAFGLAAICLAGGVLLLFLPRGVEGWSKFKRLPAKLDATDIWVAEQFCAKDATEIVRFDALFQYFFGGFIRHAGPQMSLIHYRGLPSIRGFWVAGLEGFARTAPLFGAWLYAGRGAAVTDPYSGVRHDLPAKLGQAILAGTDPASPHYWGSIAEARQRAVEAADIVRLLWLSRTQIWDQFSVEEKQQIVDWLIGIEAVEVPLANNWLLFHVLVRAFLKSTGFLPEPDYCAYFEFKGNYLGHGWFKDGPDGPVDYYNTWGITYDLFWIGLIDPQLDADFIRSAVCASGKLTSHLISPKGIPIMGRSCCYRLGIPAPIVAASIVDPEAMSPGLARHALDMTWRYFCGHRVLRDGTMTMGYLEEDPRLVDLYSGPGSAHWGLRSLTLAYMLPPEHVFWTAPSEPLPIEQRDFDLNLSELGWRITGSKADGNIVVTIPANSADHIPATPYSLVHRLKEFITHKPWRPGNQKVKYRLSHYPAQRPFAGCFD